MRLCDLPGRVEDDTRVPPNVLVPEDTTVPPDNVLALVLEGVTPFLTTPQSPM